MTLAMPKQLDQHWHEVRVISIDQDLTYDAGVSSARHWRNNYAVSGVTRSPFLLSIVDQLVLLGSKRTTAIYAKEGSKQNALKLPASVGSLYLL